MSESESMADQLKVMLVNYQTLLKRDVDRNTNKRNLDMHNTTLINFKQQIETIDELLDLLEDGEEVVG
jgi:hypothetical protein